MDSWKNVEIYQKSGKTFKTKEQFLDYCQGMCKQFRADYSSALDYADVLKDEINLRNEEISQLKTDIDKANFEKKEAQTLAEHAINQAEQIQQKANTPLPTPPAEKDGKKTTKGTKSSTKRGHGRRSSALTTPSVWLW